MTVLSDTYPVPFRVVVAVLEAWWSHHLPRHRTAKACMEMASKCHGYTFDPAFN